LPYWEGFQFPLRQAGFGRLCCKMVVSVSPESGQVKTFCGVEMSKQTISLVTYSDLPNLDPDDQLLKVALEKRGFVVKPLIWDQCVSARDSEFCIMRSAWDYHRKYEQFCTWLRETAARTRMFNTPETMLWNSRKTYLAELQEAGIAIVPTVFITNENRQKLCDILKAQGWNEAVVKPSIGLATSGVKKLSASTELSEAEMHVDDLLKHSEVMVQQYLASVHDYGERALIFIEGQLSHCVRKAPFQKLAVAFEAGERAVTASEEEIEFASRVLRHLKEVPLYARVDLIRDNSNKPVLIELELVEPSLFLQTNPESAEKFADAIIERMESAQVLANA
jgi:glutathione synthase/RimK-type ligase-like ATP-grasp enzyme